MTKDGLVTQGKMSLCKVAAAVSSQMMRSHLGGSWKDDVRRHITIALGQIVYFDHFEFIWSCFAHCVKKYSLPIPYSILILTQFHFPMKCWITKLLNLWKERVLLPPVVKVHLNTESVHWEKQKLLLVPEMTKKNNNSSFSKKQCGKHLKIYVEMFQRQRCTGSITTIGGGWLCANNFSSWYLSHKPRRIYSGNIFSFHLW